MTATEAIRNRHSIRKYKPDGLVTDEQVQTMLEAAMLAPSAINSRPWEFVVVRSRELLDGIMKVHPYTKMLATASLAIIVCAVPDEQRKKIDVEYFPQDCGAATQNILLQAVELGLGTCWCGVYPRPERVTPIKELLGIESVPFCVIAVGVPDEAPAARGFFEPAKVKYM